jgi:voltage-gated potassium channel
MGESGKTELGKVGFLDLYTGFVALYSILLLLIGWLVKLTDEEARMFAWADLALCALFLFDLCVRFHKADDKLRFWKWGWIDLLASVPMLPFLRWGRAIRLVRIFQLVRAVQGVRFLRVHMFKGQRVSAPVLAFFLFYTIIMTCAPAVLLAESNAPDATIHTARDAVWWVFETISTVGYGDLYPITTMGRAVGVMTMIFGVGMFGAITATVLAIFGFNSSAPSTTDAELETLKSENARLKSILGNQNKAAKKTPDAGNDCNLAKNP